MVATEIRSQRTLEATYRSPPLSLSDISQHDADSSRGRSLHQSMKPINRANDAKSATDAPADHSNTNQPQKRKRSRKGLERNFACPHPECGKSYSRAEHLYRHQLNHAPKRIYICKYPGCERRFVRQDLCVRHEERHTARGSNLQRKDNASATAAPQATATYEESSKPYESQVHNVTMAQDLPLPPDADAAIDAKVDYTIPFTTPEPQRAFHIAKENTARNQPVPPQEQPGISGGTYPDALHRSIGLGTIQRTAALDHSDSPTMTSHHQQFYPVSHSISHNESHKFYPPAGCSELSSRSQSTALPMYPMTPPGSRLTSANPNNEFAGEEYSSPRDCAGAPGNSSQDCHGHHGIINGPHAYHMTALAVSQSGSFSHDLNHYQSDSHAQDAADLNSSLYALPVWDHESYTHSPRITTEDFVKFLFSENSVPQMTSPGLPNYSTAMLDPYTFPNGNDKLHSQWEALDRSQASGDYATSQSHPMALETILDPDSPHANLTDQKRQELLSLIEHQFTDVTQVIDLKDKIFCADNEAEDHMLSLRSIRLYIHSYWCHFHPQMPILHKPTFYADKADNLLLIAIMIVGASCLDKMHDPNLTRSAAELSNFLAWHLRGEIFKYTIPPAKLWVFQTLLLLEIYEKLYATRLLHERAHIHHGTTLTLLRRGSYLIGRISTDSLPDINASAHKPTADDAGVSAHNLDEIWWQHWISHELTRRVAFAAYIIDSIHAAMFGHQATMVAHEMKLPLPCDEQLWAATSGPEVYKIESRLRAEGARNMTFFEGLKSTLNQKSVRTNTFGRIAIMAGLLSVTWHMNQREVQFNQLGALKASSSKEPWRHRLTQAFNFWLEDFQISKGKGDTYGTFNGGKADVDNIFDSQNVLHCLSHIAMHVDVVSCQIFAGAGRLLNRTTLQSDYELAQKRIRHSWAPKITARHATYHALKFLQQMLLPGSTKTHTTINSPSIYSARDDFLLNRSWVLYYAVLVVWSYGFSLDGCIKNPPCLATIQDQEDDMRKFLERARDLRSPAQLETMPDRNACLGLLYVLRHQFSRCRWQLLHEAASLLDNCIMKLRGSEE